MGATRSRRRRTIRNGRPLKGGNKEPKVAILFCGRIKGFEETADNLKWLKDTYKAVSFCSLNKATKTKYITNFCSLMDISDDRLRLEPTPPVPDSLKKVLPPKRLTDIWRNGGNMVSNQYSNWYHIKESFKLLEAYQKKHGMTFDIILYYRADIMTHERLTFSSSIKDRTLYIPDNPGYSCDHGGLCMTFLYGNYSSMQSFSNMVDALEGLCGAGVEYRTEPLLKHCVVDNKLEVERFKFSHYLSFSRHRPNAEANA